MELKTISVGTLKAMLKADLDSLPDDAQVFFGSGDLSLYRIKLRSKLDGDSLLQFEFNELYTVNPT